MSDVKRYDFYCHGDMGGRFSAASEIDVDGDYVRYEDYAAQIAERDARIATLEAACEASARWYKFHKRGFPIATPQAEELMVHYLRAAGYLKEEG